MLSKSLEMARSWCSLAVLISSTVGRFSEAPYAAHSDFSIFGGDSRREFDRDRDRERRRGAPGTCVDGGGVMSDADNGGGESNLLFSDCDVWLLALVKSGDAESFVRWTEFAGMLNSTGGAREPCEN